MRKWSRDPLDGGEGYPGGSKVFITIADSLASFKTP